MPQGRGWLQAQMVRRRAGAEWGEGTPVGPLAEALGRQRAGGRAASMREGRCGW
jgi:hypothetical protein